MAKQAPKAKEINPALEKAISTLLEKVMSDKAATYTDQTKIIDRAIKLEALKQKVGEVWGGDLFGPGSDDDDDGESII
jgi:hypothetical protein